ncbi:MAG: cadmium-translocating P-type ATPase [Clostridia bacterium]|nr:cadmium-translocating P-type ATPase [Clostridia bacterium]
MSENNEAGSENKKNMLHSHGEDNEEKEDGKSIRDRIIKVSAAVVLCAVAWIVTEQLTALPWWVKLTCFAVPYLLVGGEVLTEAVINVAHGELFDEEFLMSAATLGAFAAGEYTEAVFVMIFYQTGELLGDIAVGKSRRSIAALTQIRPDTAVVLREGRELTVVPENVKVGETILLRAGDRVPLDGVITEGITTLDVSALTGESMPAEAFEGSEVFSGSVNLTGTVKIRVTAAYGESTVTRILNLMEESAQNKAKSESFITRFSHIYTPAVVIGAVLLAVVPSLVTGEWEMWIYRALTFLVVSCPCALVISVPLTFFCGLGAASSRGILIKGSNFLEALADVDTVVFDKTGTVTRGCFVVDSVQPADGMDSDGLLEIAALAERYSTHPIASALTSGYGKETDSSRLGKVTELSGKAGRGIEAEIDGVVYYVGNESLMKSLGVNYIETSSGGTVVHICRDDGKYLGLITVSDMIKEDSALAVAKLRKCGVSGIIMLTGDNDSAAAVAAEKVGITEYRAGLLPDGKVTEVERLIDSGCKVAFVGDGINDAPVLARADVGVAMGALGSDAAVEAADIVLMDDKLTGLPRAIGVCRRTVRIVRENILFALTVKFLILALSAVGLAGMWLAAFGDVGVMLIAVLNALRALRVSE